MIESLNFKQRLCAGTVIAIYVFAVDVELDDPLNGIRRARLLRTHWADESQVWRIGERVPKMFIIGLSSDGRDAKGHGHWFASLKWLNPKANPWWDAHSDYPVNGKVYSGHIVAHASERTAVVELGTHQLDAFLPLNEVPDGTWRSITDLLPLGLRLQVMVISVDSARLKLLTSVSALIKQRAQQQGNAPHQIGEADPHTPHLRYVTGKDEQPWLRTPMPQLLGFAGPKITPPDWQRYGILLIDNDIQFGKNLIAWCKQFQARAWHVANKTALAALLKHEQDNITHILMDFDLGSEHLRTELLGSVKQLRQRIPLAIVSGLPEKGAVQFASDEQLGFIAKPLNLAIMNQWLIAEKLPKHQVMEQALAWQRQPPGLAQHWLLQAQDWLTTLARHTRAEALIWLSCDHPEYLLTGHVGFSERDIAASLAQCHLERSIVADVAKTGQPLSSTDTSALRMLWPAHAKQLWVLPLAQVPKSTEVLLVFFAQATGFADYYNGAISPFLGWWRSILQLRETEAMLADDTVFATQGRVFAVTMHEIRPLLQVFDSNIAWDGETAQLWWPQGKKIHQIVAQGLYNLRRYRSQQINLYDRISMLFQSFLWQMASQCPATIIVYLPPRDLLVTIPPELLEHILINLVDNACKACNRRRWAKIEVNITLDMADRERPLLISVTDQGRGLRPDEIRHLYKPRHSHSGQKGTGLGLYILKNLLTMVDGTISLKETYYWTGSQFEVRLPLTWAAAESLGDLNA